MLRTGLVSPFALVFLVPAALTMRFARIVGGISRERVDRRARAATVGLLLLRRHP